MDFPYMDHEGNKRSLSIPEPTRTQDWDLLLSLFSQSPVSTAALATNDSFVGNRLAQVSAAFLLKNIDQLVDNYRQLAGRLIDLGLATPEQANFVPQFEQAGFGISQD